MMKIIYNALQLLSTAPMAANIIVIASLKFYPEKVVATVLLSLLFALIYTGNGKHILKRP